MQYLILNGRRLSNFPDNIFENLTSLKLLDISGNNSLTLPKLRGLTNLITFSVSGLENSPPGDTFKGLKGLGAIHLSKNNLTTLSENIFEDQTNLTSLNIDGSQLMLLPENIFKNQLKLGQLDLANNLLTTLPENIFGGQTETLCISKEIN